MTAPKFRTAIIMLSALAAGVATPAFASGESRSITVSYADLNLMSEPGVARLNTRVNSAADSVCGVRGTRSLHETLAARECKTATMSRAARDVEFAIAAQRGNSQFASRADASIGVSSR